MLCFCARGGQRSQSLSYVLSKIGYNVTHLEKGYKAYRNLVIDFLETFKTNFIIISGLTGSGKGLLLNKLRDNGGQVLDLEWCANHRGSILGRIPNIEPSSQK